MALMKIDLRPGEKLQIGDATVVWEQKSGQLVRLVVDADRSIPIKKMASSSSSVRLIAEHGIMTA